MPRRKTHEEFINELKAVNPNVIALGTYINSSTKIMCRCAICKYEWPGNPQDLLHGHGCYKCRNKKISETKRKTKQQFVQELSAINPNIEVLGDYITNKDPIKCRCKLCNNVWNPIPDKLLSGKGCPDCNHVSTSLVEQIIRLALQFSLPSATILSRDRKIIKRELDVVVPELNAAIEYGAFYWHKDKLDQDSEKAALCRKNGMRLIRIYDRCQEPIEDDTDVIVFSEDFYDNDAAIKHMLRILYKKLNIKYNLSEDTYLKIKNEAYVLSRKLTTAELKRKLKTYNPDILVLGEYKGNHEGIEVQCKKCKRKWITTPHTLLTGYQCRQCFLNELRSKNEKAFLEKLNKINPNIILESEFKGTAYPIKWRCRVCGKQWEANKAGSLLRYGCKECARLEKIGKTKLSHEEYVKKVFERNPSIEITGKYIGSHKPITCRCKQCGREWEAKMAFYLTDGHRKCRYCKKNQN